MTTALNILWRLPPLEARRNRRRVETTLWRVRKPEEIRGHADSARINFAVLSEKPWKLESVVLLLPAIFVCMILGGIVVGIVRHFLGSTSSVAQTATLLIAALSFQGATLVLAIFFLRRHAITWSDAFGLKLCPKEAALIGFAVAFAFLPVGWVLQWASLNVLSHFNVETVEQQAVQVLRVAQSWPNRFVLGVLAVILAPAAEEILFRGIFYPAAKQLWSRRAALWSTSLLFAMVHSNFSAIFELKFSAFISTLGTFLPLTLLAMVLAELYERTGNLLASITAHSAFNTANFVMLYVMQNTPVRP